MPSALCHSVVGHCQRKTRRNSFWNVVGCLTRMLSNHLVNALCINGVSTITPCSCSKIPFRSQLICDIPPKGRRNNAMEHLQGAYHIVKRICDRGSERLGHKSGSEKGVFWKRGLFRKVHVLEILENLEILEFLENPQTVEKKGDSDHFLEILENFEILEILDISPAKRPLS